MLDRLRGTSATDVRKSISSFVRSKSIVKTAPDTLVDRGDEPLAESKTIGLDVPLKLIDKNEEDFTRKFKFDKAQYH